MLKDSTVFFIKSLSRILTSLVDFFNSYSQSNRLSVEGKKFMNQSFILFEVSCKKSLKLNIGSSSSPINSVILKSLSRFDVADTDAPFCCHCLSMINPSSNSTLTLSVAELQWVKISLAVLEYSGIYPKIANCTACNIVDFPAPLLPYRYVTSLNSTFFVPTMLCILVISIDFSFNLHLLLTIQFILYNDMRSK